MTHPVALAVQQVRPFQVVVVKVALTLGPLHAGRDFVQDACWDALLHKVCELCVRVLHACGKGLQEVVRRNGWPGVTRRLANKTGASIYVRYLPGPTAVGA